MNPKRLTIQVFDKTADIAVLVSFIDRDTNEMFQVKWYQGDENSSAEILQATNMTTGAEVDIPSSDYERIKEIRDTAVEYCKFEIGESNFSPDGEMSYSAQMRIEKEMEEYREKKAEYEQKLKKHRDEK